MDDKEFTFESEEILKKRSLRKYILIGAGALILIAIAVLVILLAVRDRKNTHSSEEGAVYPYTWKVKGESIELAIDRGNQTDYSWVLTTEPQFTTIEASASGTSASSKFTLTPWVPCIEDLVFRLQRGDDALDVLYEYSVRLEASLEEEGKPLVPTISSIVSRVVQQNIIVDDEKASYAIAQTEDGVLDVHISDRVTEVREREDATVFRNPETGETLSDAEIESVIASAEADPEGPELRRENSTDTTYRVHSDWTIEVSDADILSFEGPSSDDDETIEADEKAGISVRLFRGEKAGTAAVKIRSEAAGKELVLTVNLTETGEFTVAAHSVSLLDTTGDEDPGHEVEWDSDEAVEYMESLAAETEEVEEAVDSEESEATSGEGSDETEEQAETEDSTGTAE